MAHFQPLRQPPGSNSCLPTAVRTVLLWHGEDVSSENVSRWCREDAEGCVLFLALQGLQDEGFDIVEVRDETALREVFIEEEPEPVVILIRDPLASGISDHAVVLLAIRQEQNERETLEYMDPLDGAIHFDRTGTLLQWWDFNGSRGFVVRP